MAFGYVPAPVPAAIRDRVDATLRPHFPDVDEAWDEIAGGGAQLWIADGGSSALISRRLGDTLEIWMMAGRMDAVANLPTIEAAAIAAGMTRMTLFGRPGWARLLSGWRVVERVGRNLLLEKDLADGR